MRSTFPAGWLLSTARRHRRLAIVSLALGLLAALACGVALARPWSAHIEVGGLLDGPFLRGFHAHEHDGEVNFRWSDVSSAVVLPGAGAAAVQLRVHSQADGKQLTIDDGGGATTLRLRPGWQTLWLAPRASQGSGDVRVAIATTPATSGADPRQLGVVLDWIDLGGQSAPAGQAALLGTIVALVVALAGWALGRAWAGVVAGAALGIGGLAALTWDGGAYRLLLTCYTGRLALTLALALALGAAVERGLAPADGGGAWRHRLAAVVALVFLARLAGMAYPLAFISDIRFHLYRSELIRDGRLLELLLPNSSLTPMQWQSDITIPYSPLYYMLLAPAMWLPGSGPALAMMAFSSLVDALAALLAAALVILGGGGRRGALAAATLMGFLPFGLLVSVSWGLFPTLLGQCLALLAIVTWLWARPRLSRRRELWLVAAAMTLASALLVLAATGWLPPLLCAVSVALAGFGTGLAGPSRDMLIKRAAPPGATGRVYGTVYSGLDLGFCLAAPVFGALLDRGIATGDTGFRGISGPVGSPRWWAGVLFVLALLTGVLEVRQRSCLERICSLLAVLYPGRMLALGSRALRARE